jgi:putative ABC transport system permease protein
MERFGSWELWSWQLSARVLQRPVLEPGRRGRPKAGDTIGWSLYAPRMGALLLSVFGALALLLAALGVYGVLAFSISRRMREIGIRMALGADKKRVFGLVLREGMWLVAIGLGIGLGAGLYASKWINSFLFDVSTRDVTTFVVVPCVLAAVALLACYLPARRAMRVDPMVALRDS